MPTRLKRKRGISNDHGDIADHTYVVTVWKAVTRRPVPISLRGGGTSRGDHLPYAQTEGG